MKHKITIPEPCHENWDKMTPNENGRFCASCSKTVIDFTQMLPEEIQHFFTQNQNEKICGRFRKSQLDTITIQIPSKILYTQMHYHKIFLLALFITMGTTLFSCADKEGKKKKIEAVEVVEDTSKMQQVIVGSAPTPKYDPKDTLHKVPPPPPPPKTDQVKFVMPKEKATSNKTTDASSKNKKNQVSEEPVYNGGVAIETNADFPGGIDQFYTFFGKEFKMPQGSNSTKIRLSFAVERNGSVSYLQSDPEVDKTIENEIVRVLKLCPKWEPGTSNGKKITRQYSLPITLE
ncbi:energy transducer TonB [Flavobacterium mesophilum]|uniref:energy transducer TonB n=1 Tax=Flavobacterium mesophilum TaxID=3143495 RepID=UPI0031DB2FC1